jgi:hypothetical protein
LIGGSFERDESLCDQPRQRQRVKNRVRVRLPDFLPRRFYDRFDGSGNADADATADNGTLGGSEDRSH